MLVARLCASVSCVEFMGWSKWQWYGVCICPITACFD